MKTNNTIGKEYTNRLLYKQSVRWKLIFDVQRPYRKNINKLNLGFTLDLGCGIGRNLLHIKGNGVGIDHNKNSIEICKQKGLIAYTNEEFIYSQYAQENYFDSILLAHVAEHMTEDLVIEFLMKYLPFLKKSGKIVIITPQEAGFLSDKTHVQFIDFNAIRRIFCALKVSPKRFYSFPFPRFAGRFFKYNEFIAVAEKN